MHIKDPRVIFKLLGNGEKDIFHTIKWLEEIHRNVERELNEFLKRSRDEVPPDIKSSEWGWLRKILNPVQHKKKTGQGTV